MKSLGYKKSTADPCLYYKWDTMHGLLVWISWCDDLVLFGSNKEVVLREVTKVKRLFEIDDAGPLVDYLGCRLEIDWEKKSCHITQPVLIQSLKDEYNPSDTAVPLPANPRTVLRKADKDDGVNRKRQKEYRAKVGRILHMAAWSRPDITNATREVSRHGQHATIRHHRALDHLITYLWHTAKRGWLLQPTRTWTGSDQSFQFHISGKSDSDYATCKDTRKSVSGYVVYLEDAPITVKSVMQKIIALSVTEAELIALVQCIQEMIFAKKVVESMGLLVKTQMIVYCDNKGAVDLINGHSVGGNTKHIDVRILHMRDLKEKEVVLVKWISTDENESDVNTKNTGSKVYNKHIQRFVGHDEYIAEARRLLDQMV